VITNYEELLPGWWGMLMPSGDVIVVDGVAEETYFYYPPKLIDKLNVADYWCYEN